MSSSWRAASKASPSSAAEGSGRKGRPYLAQTPTNIDYWKNNGYIDTDRKTIKKRVPEREYRWVLQNETKGQNQQRASHVQYDWVRIWAPKV